jgi:O-antigen/teichoic acid export membrane protein
VVSCFAEEVLTFMVSQEFRGSWKVVPWLSFSFVFTGVYYIFVNPLFLKKTTHVPFVTFGSAFLGIMLNMTMIPRFGMMGAAISNLISLAASSVFALIISSMFEPMGFNWIKIYAFACGPFLLSQIAFLGEYLPLSPWAFFGIKLLFVAVLGFVSLSLYHREAATALSAIKKRLKR